MGRLNKPRKEGYEYRSPNQTNARDLTPNLEEDVVASQRADAGRVRRGLEADSRNALGRRMQQEAGGRALIRTGGRGGLGSLALQGGYEAGRALDESTGIGKKMVNAVMGEPEEDSDRGAVELSRAAKAQLEEDRQASAMARAKASMGMPSSLPKTGYKSGGKVNTFAKGGSVRGDGCAQRGKTKGRYI